MANEFTQNDMCEEEREIFYSFLGHMKSINQHHYQAPDVAKIYSKVTPVLEKIGFQLTLHHPIRGKGLQNFQILCLPLVSI